jgi:hypothetical protein
MPVRHEGDFQRKQIRSWDSWIDEAIQEAQERGEFDNLPDHGKPIKVEETPFAPDMNAALTTLKNAGYAPTWMELDREITKGKEDLDTFLRRSAAYLERLTSQLEHGDSPALPTASERQPGRWRRFIRWLTFASDTEAARPHVIEPADLAAIRDRMRDQYLERTAEVDKKVSQFHAALPRNLWHLERMRLTPEVAARKFDEALPPRVSS